MCPPCNIAFFKKSGRHSFFGKHYKNRFFEDFEKSLFWEKKAELLPARFQGPPKMGVTFFRAFFFLLVFLFLLHLARGCSKKTLFL